MRYESEYEEFRQMDARDREMRADQRAERTAEIMYPATPMRPTVNPFVDAICAYCGETARHCECWS
jgi:hypothetical protein